MKNLERAVRLFRFLVESDDSVQVTSATLWSWPEVQNVLQATPEARQLLQEMEKLPEAVRQRTLRYCGSFEPLDPKGDVFVFPDDAAAQSFITEMEEHGAMVDHVDDLVVAAHHETPSYTVETATRFGGVAWDGPSLNDAFERVDTDLPYAMLADGIDASAVEVALCEALWKGRDEALSEAFIASKTPSVHEMFKGRLASWAIPRPVFGVDARVFEALRLSGALPARLCALVEADPTAGEAAPAGTTVAPPADRGGVALDSPTQGTGDPAQSQNGKAKAPKPPTEHVPTREEGGEVMGQVRLPDGTVVPPDVMRQAIGKVLHNIATQVEQGTMNGKPEAKPAADADQEQDQEGPEVEPEPTPDTEELKAPGEKAPVAAKPVAKQAPPAAPAPAPAAESYIHEDLGRALGLVLSPRTADVIAGINLVRATGFSGQSQQMVERILDELDTLQGSPNARVRKAAREAIATDLYMVGESTKIPILHDGLTYGEGREARPGMPVAIVEDRGTNLVLRLQTGETVLAPVSAVSLVEAGRRTTSIGENRKSVGAAILGRPYTMNVAKVSPGAAASFAKDAFEQAGLSLYEEIPDFDRNLLLLKRKMSHALDIPRIQMPVIEPSNIDQFDKDLKAGRVDIFKPYAAGLLGGGQFPRYPELRGGAVGKEWLVLGVMDGDKADDIVVPRPGMIPVKNLMPLQNEIWFDKLIGEILKHGVPKEGGYLLTSAVIIVSQEGYILDGHHRFGQAMLADPDLKIKALKIPMDIDTLLKVGRSYGSAIGNVPKGAKESVVNRLNRPAILGTSPLYGQRNPLAPRKQVLGDRRMGESVNEQLDVGQDDETTQAAKGFKKTAEKLKQCRQHTFDLVTADLVQLESLAKAVDAKRTAKLLAQTREKVTDFLDALKEVAELLEKSNEAFKGESGGKGGDTVDLPPAAAAVAPVAPAVPAAVPAPAAVVVGEAIKRVARTDIPGRIAEGEHYDTIMKAIGYHTADLGLDASQLGEVYDRLNRVVLSNDGQSTDYQVEFSPTDHRLLESVARHGTRLTGLAQRAAGRRQTFASRDELVDAVSALRQYGKAEHAMLADDLAEIVGGR